MNQTNRTAKDKLNPANEETKVAFALLSCQYPVPIHFNYWFTMSNIVRSLFRLSIPDHLAKKGFGKGEVWFPGQVRGICPPPVIS